jgi:hypothetical protein
MLICIQITKTMSGLNYIFYSIIGFCSFIEILYVIPFFIEFLADDEVEVF